MSEENVRKISILRKQDLCTVVCVFSIIIYTPKSIKNSDRTSFELRPRKGGVL